jgi:hypothetical protein
MEAGEVQGEQVEGHRLPHHPDAYRPNDGGLACSGSKKHPSAAQRTAYQPQASAAFPENQSDVTCC